MQEAVRVAEPTHPRKAEDRPAHGRWSNTDHRHSDGIQLTSHVGGKKSGHCKTGISDTLKLSSIPWWNLINIL